MSKELGKDSLDHFLHFEAIPRAKRNLQKSCKSKDVIELNMWGEFHMAAGLLIKQRHSIPNRENSSVVSIVT